MALKVLKELKATFPNAEYYGFDPQLTQESIEALGLKYIARLSDELQDKDMVLITNNHPYFKKEVNGKAARGPLHRRARELPPDAGPSGLCFEKFAPGS